MNFKQALALAALSSLCHIANAATVTFNFTSSGDNSSSAVGWFSYDAAAVGTTIVLSDLSAFNWTINGGVLNGTTLTRSDLTEFSASFVSDDFTSELYFAGTSTNTSEAFVAAGAVDVFNANWEITYTNTPTGFTVPTPSVIWLWGAGVIGLMALSKRKQTTL